MILEGILVGALFGTLFALVYYMLRLAWRLMVIPRRKGRH
jgi:hypothetical protein